MFVERLRRSAKYEEVYLHAYDSVADARQGWIVSLRSTIVGGLIPASTNGHLTKYIESQPAQLADQLRGRESTYRLGIVVRKGGASSYCLSSIRSHPGANVMNHKLSSPFSVIVKTD